MHSNKISGSKSTTKINLISTLIVLILVGIGILGYLKWTKSTVDVDSNPPSLSFGSTSFKGELLKSSVFITFTQEDENEWTDPAGTYITLKPGFNYVYSPSERSMAEIVDNFKPDKDNSMLVIVYSPSSSLFGQQGYNIYKKGPYPGTNEITSPSSFDIPAYYGLIVYTDQETKAWGLKNSSSALTWEASNKEGLELMNSLNGINGWVLIPTPSAAKLSDFFGSLKTKVLYFSKLETKSTYDGDGDFEDGTTGPASFSVNTGAYFMWVKLGTPETTCDPGKYFSVGSCNSCNSQQYYSGWASGIQCVQCPTGVPFSEVSGCAGTACVSPKYVTTSGVCTSCQGGFKYTGGGQCLKCATWEYSSGMCEPCQSPNFAFTGTAGCTACNSWQKPSGGLKACVDCGYGQKYSGSLDYCTACSDMDYYTTKTCRSCSDFQPV